MSSYLLLIASSSSGREQPQREPGGLDGPRLPGICRGQCQIISEILSLQNAKRVEFQARIFHKTRLYPEILQFEPNDSVWVIKCYTSHINFILVGPNLIFHTLTIASSIKASDRPEATALRRDEMEK